jgi:hypothetical protein
VGERKAAVSALTELIRIDSAVISEPQARAPISRHTHAPPARSGVRLRRHAAASPTVAVVRSGEWSSS